MDPCIFCKIVAKEIPAAFVYEDEWVVAFADIHPMAPQHYLIIPRRHLASVNEAAAENAAELGRLFVAARAIAQSRGFAENGYRLVINTGADAGQAVGHLHLHLLAGREMGWNPA